MSVIDEIIEKEWAMNCAIMSGAGNEGPSDLQTAQFKIQRESQFKTWPEQILFSYLNDLSVAEAEGRNLHMEKSIWMINLIDEDRFDKLIAMMPASVAPEELSPSRRGRIRNSASIHAEWAQEFAQKYPAIASKGRAASVQEGTANEPSVEAYIFGELCSYSDFTEQMFSQFVYDCMRDGRNLYLEIQENMAKALGYESLEAMEEACK